MFGFRASPSPSDPHRPENHGNPKDDRSSEDNKNPEEGLGNREEDDIHIEASMLNCEVLSSNPYGLHSCRAAIEFNTGASARLEFQRRQLERGLGRPLCSNVR